MIDRCDDDIATWSESGENFVVKNVEKFATVSTPKRVAPLLMLAPPNMETHGIARPFGHLTFCCSGFFSDYIRASFHFISNTATFRALLVSLTSTAFASSAPTPF